MASISEKIESVIAPLFEEKKLAKYELVDVEYKKEGENWFLRVFIDSDSGVQLDDCQLVSNTIDKILDEHDFIPNAYFLEVSSPGIERPLKKPKDFQKYIGEQIKVKSYAPILDKLKEIVGVISDANEDSVKLKYNDQELEIDYKDIASAQLWADL